MISFRVFLFFLLASVFVDLSLLSRLDIVNVDIDVDVGKEWALS